MIKLPRQWRRVPIRGLIAETQSGFACSKKNLVSDGLPHLRPFNVGLNGELDYREVYCIPSNLAKPNAMHLEAGDILYNNTNSVELVGKSAIVKEDIQAGFSNHLDRLRVLPDVVLPEWFNLSLRMLWKEGVFAKLCRRWIGQAGFSVSELSSLDIILPPLEEQRRIVARIEELTERIDEARRIRAAANEEADKLMDAALKGVLQRAGLDGWGNFRLRDIVQKSEKRDPRKTPDVKFQYVDISSINSDLGVVETSTAIVGKEAPSRARKVIRADDVVFATTRPYLKNIAMIPSELDNHICSTGFCVLRPLKEKVSPRWTYYLCRSELVLNQIVPVMRGASYPAVTDKDVLSAEIPLPPIAAQNHLIEYLDNVQARANQLRRLQEETQADLDSLSQAILAKAFRGEL